MFCNIKLSLFILFFLNSASLFAMCIHACLLVLIVLCACKNKKRYTLNSIVKKCDFSFPFPSPQFQFISQRLASDDRKKARTQTRTPKRGTRIIKEFPPLAKCHAQFDANALKKKTKKQENSIKNKKRANDPEGKNPWMEKGERKKTTGQKNSNLS